MLWDGDKDGAQLELILELFPNLEDSGFACVESDCTAGSVWVCVCVPPACLPPQDTLPPGSALSAYPAPVFLGPAPEIIVYPQWKVTNDPAVAPLGISGETPQPLTGNSSAPPSSSLPLGSRSFHVPAKEQPLTAREGAPTFTQCLKKQTRLSP